MRFYSQGNEKALMMIARQLKKDPRKMLKEAFSKEAKMAKKTGDMKAASNRSSKDLQTRYEQWEMDEFDNSMP